MMILTFLSFFFSHSQVPLYRESSGFSIPQSGAIERYLARKNGLAGSDHEVAVIDSIAEARHFLVLVLLFCLFVCFFSLFVLMCSPPCSEDAVF
jgi:hypothetical protein